MGITVYSSFWVMQDLCHQQYYKPHEEEVAFGFRDPWEVARALEDATSPAQARLNATHPKPLAPK